MGRVPQHTSLTEGQERQQGRCAQQSNERQLRKGVRGQGHNKERTGKVLTTKQNRHPWNEEAEGPGPRDNSQSAQNTVHIRRLSGQPAYFLPSEWPGSPPNSGIKSSGIPAPLYFPVKQRDHKSSFSPPQGKGPYVEYAAFPGGTQEMSPNFQQLEAGDGKDRPHT